MILATWNVNSIRARLEHAVQWIHARQPDILCFQELKCQTDDFPGYEFETEGYQCVVLGQKARNGVAIVTKEMASPIQKGFDNEFDPENSRFIAATIAGIHVITVYVPNGQSPDSPHFEYKRDFFRELRSYCANIYSPDDFVAIVGDFNVAPDDIDVYNPDLLRDTICFHPDEQADFVHLKSWGLIDLFRKMNPAVQNFSWWDYRAGGYPRNHGMRLDHILVTKPLAEKCVSCTIDREPRGWDRPSDHAPVLAEFSL